MLAEFMDNIFVEWFTPDEWYKRNLKYSVSSKIRGSPYDIIVKWTKKFKEFHGLSNCKGLILDVGSGSGLYCGVPYEESPICYYEGDKVNLDPFILIPIDKSVIGVGEFLPFRNGIFDAELCSSTLRHMINISEAANEMHRVLKKGSHLFLACEVGREADSKHLRNPSAQNIKELFETHHFKLKRVTAKEKDGELQFDNHLFYLEVQCIFDFLKE